MLVSILEKFPTKDSAKAYRDLVKRKDPDSNLKPLYQDDEERWIVEGDRNPVYDLLTPRKRRAKLGASGRLPGGEKVRFLYGNN